MTKIKISEIMETDIPRLKTGNTLLEIAEIFKSSGYTVLPVYDESGRFVGFITLWNIMKIFIPPYFALFKRLDIPTNFGVIEKTLLDFSTKLFVAYDIITTKLITVDENDSALKALAIMARENLAELPVMSGDKFAGIIRASRIIHHIASSAYKDVIDSK